MKIFIHQRKIVIIIRTAIEIKFDIHRKTDGLQRCSDVCVGGIWVIIPPPPKKKLLYPQNKFLATPLMV